MQEYGTVTAQIVTSAAQIPIPGATLTITRELPDGRQELLAVRMTNYDGFTEPFDVPTPPASDSQTRQTAEMPYALVDLRGERAGYDRVFIHNAQIFPGIQTLQQIVLIPTPTLPVNMILSGRWSINACAVRCPSSSGYTTCAFPPVIFLPVPGSGPGCLFPMLPPWSWEMAL